MRIQNNTDTSFGKGKIVASKKGKDFLTNTIRSLMNMAPDRTELHITESATPKRWQIGFKLEGEDSFIASKDVPTSMVSQTLITDVVKDGWDLLVREHKI